MELVADYFSSMYFNKKRPISLLRQLQFKRGTLDSWNRMKFFSTGGSSVAPSTAPSLTDTFSDTLTGTIRGTMLALEATGLSLGASDKNLTTTGKGASGKSGSSLDDLQSADSSRSASSRRRKRRKKREDRKRGTLPRREKAVDSLFGTGIVRPRAKLGRTWRSSVSSDIGKGKTKGRPSYAQENELTSVSSRRKGKAAMLAGASSGEKLKSAQDLRITSKLFSIASKSSRIYPIDDEDEEIESEKKDKDRKPAPVSVAQDVLGMLREPEAPAFVATVRNLMPKASGTFGNKFLVMSGKELSSHGLQTLRSVCNNVLGDMPPATRLRNIEIQDLRYVDVEFRSIRGTHGTAEG